MVDFLRFSGKIAYRWVMNLPIKIVQKVCEIQRDIWDGLLGSGSPLMKWDWLDSFEQTGCVNEETGWLPHHLVVEMGGRVVAVCPMYLKLHSMGEFVFDWEWAEAAHRVGIQYYPKLLVGVPFTPVTGPRFLTAQDEDRKALIRLMGQALAKVAADNKISSVHVNFCLVEEKQALEEVGVFPQSRSAISLAESKFSHLRRLSRQFPQRSAQ